MKKTLLILIAFAFFFTGYAQQDTIKKSRVYELNKAVVEDSTSFLIDNSTDTALRRTTFYDLKTALNTGATTITGITEDGSTVFEVKPVQGGTYPDSYFRVNDFGYINSFNDWTNHGYSLTCSKLTLSGNQSTFIEYDFPYTTIGGYDGIQFESKRNTGAGHYFNVISRSNFGLSDTDNHQSWLYVAPTIIQSSTASYDALQIDVTETSLGDGSTGDGNNFIRAVAGGVTKWKVDNKGVITKYALSADPPDPEDGSMIEWMSDGTETGDNGDIIRKTTAGGVTKTEIISVFANL